MLCHCGYRGSTARVRTCFESEFSIVAAVVDMDAAVAVNQTWLLIRQGGHLSVVTLRLQINYCVYISFKHSVKERAGADFV